MNSNVSEILARQSRDRPNGAAITQRRCGRDVTLTYAQLEQAVRRESRRLTESGITKGDRVLVLCPVSLQLYVAMLALLRCGGTAMFADPGAGLARLDTCCERAQPRAVIATWRASLLRPFVPALRWGPRWLSVPKLNPDAAGTDAPPPATVEADHRRC